MARLVSKEFRDALGWLHTWLGVALGAILFAIFWTGSLTVFDKEIDHWMKPELRLAQQENVSLDRVVLPKLASFEPALGSDVWISPPRDRIPAIRMLYHDKNDNKHEIMLDPKTGEKLDLTDSHAGTDFFFRFHFMLHMPGLFGYLLVGIAALGMMVLVISGVFIHRKFFQDFFTFRPKKNLLRSTLDFHNLTAIIGLPFYFLLPLSGLFIFATVFFPWPVEVNYDGNIKSFKADLAGYQQFSVEPSGQTNLYIKTLDQLIIDAEQIWKTKEGQHSSKADWVGIFNYGDENSYVIVERYFANKNVAIGPHQVNFDAQTGEKIGQFSPRPIHAALNWLEGLHWIQFDHWPLRWLYFFAGISSCAMIASGLVFWIKTRVNRNQTDPTSVRLVRAISVVSITGIIIASTGFLIANRLIPKAIELDGIHRHDLEIWAFFLIWLLALIHAALRGKSAWHEQSFTITVSSIAAVMLNFLTTENYIRSVLIIDLMLLLTAILSFSVAVHLRKADSLISNIDNKRTNKIEQTAKC